MTKSLNVIYNDALKLVDNKNVFKQDILFLMKEILKIEDNDVYIHQDKLFETDEFENALLRLKDGEPVEYILSKAYFFGNEFSVSKDTLIPRNCTEELVKKVIDYVSNSWENPHIIDIGSGSGCIALTLKKLLPNCIMESVDISEKALEVARRNALSIGIEVDFYLSDCLSEPIMNGKKYDILISNPPYIDKDTYVQESVLKYEPHLALFANNHGLAIYERIFSQAKEVMNKDSFLAFEISPDLEKGLTELANKYLPNYRFWFEKDMNDFVRFMFLRNF